MILWAFGKKAGPSTRLMPIQFTLSEVRRFVRYQERMSFAQDDREVLFFRGVVSLPR
jgi:hypothetical protein